MIHHPLDYEAHRPSLRHGLRAIGVAFLLGTCCAVQSASADPDTSMQPIIRVARANYDRIKTLDIVWTEDIQPNTGILDWPTFKKRLFEDFPTARYRYEDGYILPDSDATTEAFDGKVRTAYPWRNYNGPPAAQSAGYITRATASDAASKPDAVASTFRANAPIVFPFPPRFLEYLSECKVLIAAERSGGFTCVVADHFSDGRLEGRIWLDMDRGAMPVQVVAFHVENRPGILDGGDGKLPAPGLDSESWVTECRRFTDSKGVSVWLPTKMNQKDTDGEFEQEVDIVQTRLNPHIDPRQFRVTFPPGVPVFNPATGHFFTTDPNNASTDDNLPFVPPATQPIAPAK